MDHTRSDMYYINGFNTVNVSHPVTNVTTEHRIYKYDSAFSEYPINQGEICELLTRRIVDRLLQDKLVKFSEYTDHMTGDQVVRAKLNAVKCEQAYVNLEENGFIVDGNRFTNDELIEAVKHSFPERFI